MEALNTFQTTETKRCKRLTRDIFSLIANLGNYETGPLALASVNEIPLYRNIQLRIQQNREIFMILPAFPAKSANSNKTMGTVADMGEVVALMALNRVCQQISTLYNPGARVLICSDGRVFNDLVLVDDEAVCEYRQSITEIIDEFELSHLELFDLSDCYSNKSFAQMRSLLTDNFAPRIDDIRTQVKAEPVTRNMFNGIHRFVQDDMGQLLSHLSKNQLRKQSKNVAYQVIQRSRAWDGLLKKYFADSLRLSIHPYPITNEKFGVKLIKSSDRWATPWHNVPVLINNQFQLMKHEHALKLGAKKMLFGGKYDYYLL